MKIKHGTVTKAIAAGTRDLLRAAMVDVEGANRDVRIAQHELHIMRNKRGRTEAEATAFVARLVNDGTLPIQCLRVDWREVSRVMIETAND